MASISLSSTGRIVLIAITFLTLILILPKFFYSHSTNLDPIPFRSDPSSNSNPQQIPDPAAPLLAEPEPEPIHEHEPEADVKPPAPSSSSSQIPANATDFVFNTTLHSKSYGLSDAQCDSAFPELFAEVERAHSYRSQQGKLTLEHIDRSAQGSDLIRVLIYSGQIYILHENTGVHKNRAASIISTINRAIVASNDHIPDIEFTLSIGDMSNAENQWALTRDIEGDNKTWVMTDHVWWSWPVPLLGEFNTIRMEIADEELPFADKIPQLVWRGVIAQGPIRAKLVEASEGKTWNNISAMTWKGAGGMEGGSDEALSAWDQCNFQYLAYTEGEYHFLRILKANRSRRLILWTIQVSTPMQQRHCYA
jgi:hypothetical protein